jgi:dephospho-CoA kinase
MKVIIGLVAEKESGKTTAFNYIKGTIPGAEEIMIAGHLKNVCSRAFEIEPIRFETQEEKKRPLDAPIVMNRGHLDCIAKLFEIILDETMIQNHLGKRLATTREILQYVGTEVVRSADENIHLKWAMRNGSSASVLVVTDVRFPNEFEFFEKMDGFISVAINRPKESVDDASANHQSEAHIKDLQRRCSVLIYNDSTLAEFESRISRSVVGRVSKILSEEQS